MNKGEAPLRMSIIDLDMPLYVPRAEDIAARDKVAEILAGCSNSEEIIDALTAFEAETKANYDVPLNWSQGPVPSFYERHIYHVLRAAVRPPVRYGRISEHTASGSSGSGTYSLDDAL